MGWKWVFKVKENPNESVNKYKARLVEKGFHQQEAFNFHETFWNVVELTSIWIVLTLAITFNWEIQQIHMNNVFLNGDLPEEVYMDQPPVFVDSNNTLVCKLKKETYGLKQAPMAWYDTLHQA